MRLRLDLSMLSLALSALIALPASADPLFKITEAYTGVSGSDGTPDWFELTNFGDMAGNIGGYYYDDNSDDPTNNFQLPNFDVDPLESVIVLIEANQGDVDDFYPFWGLSSSVQVGFTGGGSLSQGGDRVNVFDGNFSGAPLIDALDYAGTGLGGGAMTIEDINGMGPLGNSMLGVRGAFLSSGTSGAGRLVGSPGIAVPEPASIALITILGAAAVAVRRRR